MKKSMVLLRCEGNWASCVSQLNGKVLASGMEVMLDRIERGKEDKEHFERGTWLAEGGTWLSENTYVLDRQILMVRMPLNVLIPYAEKATEAHALGKEFYLTNEVLLQGKSAKQILSDIAREDKNKPLIERRVLVSSNDKAYDVSWDRFGDDDTMVWLAQSKGLAKDYGKFLHNDSGLDIRSLRFYLPATNLGDIVRGNWLYGLGKKESFFSCCWYLNVNLCSAFKSSLSSR